MKIMNKLLAVLVIAMMFVTLSVPAFAAASITVNYAVNGAEYRAYRLLNTTTSLKAEGCHASDAEHLSTCYNIAYEVNDKYESILQTITGCTSDADIIAKIRDQNTVATIRAFADAVYADISTKPIPADATTTGIGETAVFEDIGSGYMLIVETISDPNYAGAYSLVMLDTTGSRDITVSTKRDEPSLYKLVRDNDITYGMAADVQIGDEVEFLVVADVPNPLGYSEYTYKIYDKMSEGLTYKAGSYDIRINGVEGSTLPAEYYRLDEEYIQIYIKKATDAGLLKADDRLYVRYKATLNEKAHILESGTIVANANPNTAWLEYSNNPYSNTTAMSAESTVYVWTFPLKLNKVDSANVGLEGAKFVLSTDPGLSEADLKDANTDNIPDGFNKMIALIAIDSDTYRVAPAGYTGAVVYEIPVGTANLQGFNDQIEYYLYETAAPAGYNKLASPVSFKFFAQYASSESYLFKDGYPSVSVNTGHESAVLEANVVNNTGAELPSTGGIGTTIFYILGGVMVVAALVFLITNKRVAGKN